MVWLIASETEAVAVKELIALPPRAAAIVGAALVHDDLAVAVAAQFPVSGSTKKNLFGENGRLADFDIQSKMAYTLGIISERAFRDCQRMARVRNLFAHRLNVTDFDHKDVARECRALELVERHLFPFGKEAEGVARDVHTKSYIKDLPSKLADNRQRYQLTAMLLTSTIRAYAGIVRPPLPRVRI